MSTLFVFDEQLSALTAGDFADADVMPMHDTSAGVKKYVTVAAMRQNLSGGIVSTTATQLTVTAASHAGKTIVVSSAAPLAVTLPAATGTGSRYRFYIAVAATGTPHTITALAGDVMQGGMAIFDTSATDITAIAFAATATDIKISLDGTTKAGTVGTVVELEDVATDKWAVLVRGAATGSYATPFSSS